MSLNKILGNASNLVKRSSMYLVKHWYMSSERVCKGTNRCPYVCVRCPLIDNNVTH